MKGHQNQPQAVRIIPRLQFWYSWIRHCITHSSHTCIYVVSRQLFNFTFTRTLWSNLLTKTKNPRSFKYNSTSDNVTFYEDFFSHFYHLVIKCDQPSRLSTHVRVLVELFGPRLWYTTKVTSNIRVYLSFLFFNIIILICSLNIIEFYWICHPTPFFISFEINTSRALYTEQHELMRWNINIECNDD